MRSLFGSTLLTLALVLIFTSGCSSSSNQNQLTGVVQLARVAGASISVYILLENGEKGALLAQTESNSAGEYTLDLGSYSGPVLIESLGGHYIDEATGSLTSVDPTLTLSNIVNSSDAAIAPITPMSTLVKERIIAQLGSSTLADARSVALEEVARLFGVEPTDLNVIPAAPYSTTATDVAAVRVSLALAAFSYLVSDLQFNGSAVSLKAVMEALKEDLKNDGKVIGNVAGEGAAGGLVNQLAFQWTNLLQSGKSQALIDDNLGFKHLDSDILDAASSATPDTGAQITLDGLQEDGSFYIGGINTGLSGGTGIFLNKFYANGTEIGTYGSSTVTIASTPSSGISFTGTENFVFSSGTTLVAGSELITSGSVTFAGSSISEGTLESPLVVFNNTSIAKGEINVMDGTVSFNQTAKAFRAIITGQAVFNGNSYNYAEIYGEAIFNDSAWNEGWVQNCVFNNSSNNNTGFCGGNFSDFKSLLGW